MLDWITVVIELVGVAILLTWIVVPIREFRQILRAVKHPPQGSAGEGPRGFPVETPPGRPEEGGPRP